MNNEELIYLMGLANAHKLLTILFQVTSTVLKATSHQTGTHGSFYIVFLLLFLQKQDDVLTGTVSTQVLNNTFYSDTGGWRHKGVSLFSQVTR